MQVIAKEWRLNVFSKFTRGLMAAERDLPDLVSFGGLPLSMEPGTSHYEVLSLRVALFGVAENLPWTPWVFLIPEAGNVQIRDWAAV